MNDADNKVGYFVFSLDTELAWGYYDRFPSPAISLDPSREREVIKRLLDIFDRYGIAATWALVGHMFYAACEKCPICPIWDWKGKYPVFNQIYESNNPLWYGEDIIDLLLERRSVHEIAFHGYTHRVFDEDELSGADARTEISEWLRLSTRKNLVPVSVTVPRNKIGYLPIFKETGFICYRGTQLTARFASLPLIGKVLNWLDFRLQFCIPEVFQAAEEAGGLVNLPASRRLFGMNAQLSDLLDRLNLGGMGIGRIIKGVEKAANENKVIHIWTHPHEFKSERDFERLALLLDRVSHEIEAGRIRSITMGGLAQKVSNRTRSLSCTDRPDRIERRNSANQQ